VNFLDKILRRHKLTILIYVGVTSIIFGTGYSLGCYLLFYSIDKNSEKQKVAISQTRLKVISWLVVAGIIITILGILNLMDILPWWH
jgi:hypothetical protein